MKTKNQSKALHRKSHQRGAALIILMLAIVLSLVTLVTFRSERKGPEQEAQRKTALALAQAKEALLGYAARDSNRPGSLPCADINDDGVNLGPDASCTANIVARLPWKQLGLPDLRDGSGERLWYAVSQDFRAFLSSPINTTTLGQITIRSATGVIISNPGTTPPSGVVAVVIAPGTVLTRNDTALTQNRNCSGGGGCNPDLVCLTPYQNVGKCNPANYLDVVVGTEDNAAFVSYRPPPPIVLEDGFIYGPIENAAGEVVVNDRILAITAKEIFSVLTQRIVGELANTSLMVPYPSSLDMVSPKPNAWNMNNWDDAVTVYSASTTKDPNDTLKLQFANCASVFTVRWDGTRNNVTRSGPC